MDAVITHSQMHKHAHVFLCFVCICVQEPEKNREQEEQARGPAQLCWSQSQWAEREVRHHLLFQPFIPFSSVLFYFLEEKLLWFLCFSSCFLFSKDSAQIVICNTVSHNVICICSPQAGDTDNILVEKIRTTWLLLRMTLHFPWFVLWSFNRLRQIKTKMNYTGTDCWSSIQHPFFLLCCYLNEETSDQ